MHLRWKDSRLVRRWSDNSFNTCLTWVWYFGIGSDFNIVVSLVEMNSSIFLMYSSFLTIATDRPLSALDTIRILFSILDIFQFSIVGVLLGFLKSFFFLILRANSVLTSVGWPIRASSKCVAVERMALELIICVGAYFNPLFRVSISIGSNWVSDRLQLWGGIYQLTC